MAIQELPRLLAAEVLRVAAEVNPQPAGSAKRGDRRTGQRANGAHAPHGLENRALDREAAVGAHQARTGKELPQVAHHERGAGKAILPKTAR